MAKVTDIGAAIAGLQRYPARTPHTTDEELAQSFARLDQLGSAGVFVATFAGTSEWERHRGGDELVQVFEGQAELTILADPPVTLSMTAGTVTVVPKGCWHRFVAPAGVSLVTVTPQPTDHFRGPGVPDDDA